MNDAGKPVGEGSHADGKGDGRGNSGGAGGAEP